MEAKKAQETEFQVDGEKCSTTEKELTPNAIMALAGIVSTTHYLIEIRGRHRESFEGRADELIKMKKGMRFISVSTGPTPVS